MFSNGGFVNFLADAGAFVLLALGLNIVVGFAGLLDLGYAAFFAIGSYTFAMLASPQFGIHIPFWVMLFVASGVAAVFGILLGAPTLRLRGDYLAIVTLGFGEIVPQTFLNLSQWTGGPNGIGSLDQPAIFGYRFGFQALPYYYLILGLIAVAVLAGEQPARQPARPRVDGDSRGRAGRGARRDQHDDDQARRVRARRVVQRPRGVRVRVEIAARLARPVRFNVSVAVLSMLVLGGMGNIPGVIVGSLVISSLDRFILPQLTNFLHGAGRADRPDELALPDLRRHPRDDDALPARRFDPQPSAPLRTARDPRRRAGRTDALYRGVALMPLLQLEGVTQRFGGFVAVDKLDFVILTTLMPICILAELDLDPEAREGIHGRVSDPGNADDRHLLGTRPGAVLLVLRGRPDPDVPDHRRVGRAAPGLCQL